MGWRETSRGSGGRMTPADARIGGRQRGMRGPKCRIFSLIMLSLLLCQNVGGVLAQSAAGGSTPSSPAGVPAGSPAGAETVLSTPVVQAPAGAEVVPGGLLEGFRIGPEDVLAISVWKTPELQQEVTVRSDGRITLRLVGEETVQGLTIGEASARIKLLYQRFLPETEVSVTLKEMNSFKVYVLGRVTRPGEYRVRSSLTVLQAVALAGGFSQYARVNKVRVLRHSATGDVLIPFVYESVIEGQAADFALQPGDRLVVP